MHFVDDSSCLCNSQHNKQTSKLTLCFEMKQNYLPAICIMFLSLHYIAFAFVFRQYSILNPSHIILAFVDACINDTSWCISGERSKISRRTEVRCSVGILRMRGGCVWCRYFLVSTNKNPGVYTSVVFSLIYERIEKKNGNPWSPSCLFARPNFRGSSPLIWFWLIEEKAGVIRFFFFSFSYRASVAAGEFSVRYL